MGDYGKRDWAEVEAHPLPAPILAMLEGLDDAAHYALRRYVVEQAWEIERLQQHIHHLRECIRETVPVVISANFSQERYPLMYAECKALAGEGD